jgi:hypothetical protein
VALTAHLGASPDPSLVVDHLCRFRHCVNVEHMELVTNDENIARGAWAPSASPRYRGRCKNGHPMGEHRYCKPCHDAWQLERCELMKAAAAKLGLSRKDYVAIHGQGKHAALAVLNS